jgi:outer membrane protein assembly factor BamB
MVALTPDGSMRWFYEANPHDLLDHDLQQSPMLVNVDNNGKPYTALIGSGKLGEVIAVEATTGNKIWMTKVGVHNEWDETQWIPTGQTVTVEPGVAGGVESPIAYADGTIYVSVLNLPSDWNSTGLVASSVDFASSSGEVVALDIKDGSIKWDTKVPAGNVSAATVSNDVVFAGGLDGLVRAYATQDGSLLWSFETAAGLNAPMAVANDLLIVPSAGPKLTPKNYKPETTPVKGNISGPAVVAFKLKA